MKKRNSKIKKMRLRSDIIYKIAMDLPFGEKRTEKEIKKSIRDEMDEEHDYMLSLYEDALEEENEK